MTTETLKIPAMHVLTAPRGARWAAQLVFALQRVGGAINDALHDLGRRRARRALIELARSVEATQPSYAQDLLAAAGAARPARHPA